MRGNAMSVIFDEENHRTGYSPELKKMKFNILFLLLILVIYGILYTIGEYLTFIIVGILCGFSYAQMRNKFIKNILQWGKNEKQETEKENNRNNIIIGLLLGICGYFVTEIRVFLKKPSFQSLEALKNAQIRYNPHKTMYQNIVRVVLFTASIFFILRPIFKWIGGKIINLLKSKDNSVISCIFFFIFILTISVFIIIIPKIAFTQFTDIITKGHSSLQDLMQCEIINIDGSQSKYPNCKEVIIKHESISSLITQIENQKDLIAQCKQYIQQNLKNYLGWETIIYQEHICYLKIIGNNLLNQTYSSQGTQQLSKSIFSTGTSVLKSIFGSLISTLAIFSNGFFNFLVWYAAFSLTKSQTFHSDTLNQIFSASQKEIITKISKLIASYVKIVITHFILSVSMFSFFSYIPSVSFIPSIILSFMAFIPYFRPWVGVLIIGIVRLIIMKEFITTLMFIYVYKKASDQIYSDGYGKLKIDEIITTYSVIFGICTFGISGIFYGPLLVILYQSIEKEIISCVKNIKLQSPQSYIGENDLERQRQNTGR